MKLEAHSLQRLQDRFKAFSSSLNYGEVVTIGWVSALLFGLLALVLLLPSAAHRFKVLGPELKTIFEINVGPVTREEPVLATFRLPRMSVTAGTSNHHLKFLPVIEYDRSILRDESKGGIRSPEDEAGYFERHTAKIQDTIVLHASDLALKSPEDGLYVEEMKIGLAEALNDTLASEGAAIKSVYFNSFEIIPAF